MTSLCPCSKRISDYGAHNQRSHITIKARISEHIWIEELIDIAEQEASCELYGILKRPDEKYVTERAYDNPKFVEDMVRDVAVRLNDEERVLRYVVEVGELRVDPQPLGLRADRARQGSTKARDLIATSATLSAGRTSRTVSSVAACSSDSWLCRRLMRLRRKTLLKRSWQAADDLLEQRRADLHHA